MATDRAGRDDIVVADIGGTHARFAIGHLGGRDGITLGQTVTLRTAAYEGLADAWQSFGETIGHPLPAEAAIAVAAPIAGEAISFTNGHWTIRPQELQSQLHLTRLAVINDFVAVAHAVTILGERYFRHLCGPDRPIGGERSITVLGPGTGLGTAHILRRGEPAQAVHRRITSVVRCKADNTPSAAAADPAIAGRGWTRRHSPQQPLARHRAYSIAANSLSSGTLAKLVSVSAMP